MIFHFLVCGLFTSDQRLTFCLVDPISWTAPGGLDNIMNYDELTDFYYLVSSCFLKFFFLVLLWFKLNQVELKWVLLSRLKASPHYLLTIFVSFTFASAIAAADVDNDDEDDVHKQFCNFAEFFFYFYSGSCSSRHYLLILYYMMLCYCCWCAVVKCKVSIQFFILLYTLHPPSNLLDLTQLDSILCHSLSLAFHFLLYVWI